MSAETGSATSHLCHAPPAEGFVDAIAAQPLDLDGARERTYLYAEDYTYMTAKLTLTVDPRVIENAKRYAARAGTSVSQLVEDYLAAVATPTPTAEAPPVLARLRGALRDVDVEDHRQFQVEKYR